MQRVDFPERAVRIGVPELRLPGVAALDALLPLRGDAGFFQSALHLDERRGIREAEPDVVEGSAGLLRAGIQGEHERRGIDFELGVVVVVLGGLEAEQRAIEAHRPRENGHV